MCQMALTCDMLPQAINQNQVISSTWFYLFECSLMWSQYSWETKLRISDNGLQQDWEILNDQTNLVQFSSMCMDQMLNVLLTSSQNKLYKLKRLQATIQKWVPGKNTYRCSSTLSQVKWLQLSLVQFIWYRVGLWSYQVMPFSISRRAIIQSHDESSTQVSLMTFWRKWIVNFTSSRQCAKELEKETNMTNKTFQGLLIQLQRIDSSRCVSERKPNKHAGHYTSERQANHSNEFNWIQLKVLHWLRMSM